MVCILVLGCRASETPPYESPWTGGENEEPTEEPEGTGGDGGDGQTARLPDGFQERGELPLFTPCGGDLVGTWRSTSIEWSAWVEGAASPRIVQDSDYRFRFEDDGSVTQARAEALLDVFYDRACSQVGGGGVVIDFDPDVPEYRTESCEDVPQGCVCRVVFDELLERGSWTVAGNSVEVSLWDYYPTIYDYCVDGETLHLVRSDGRSLTMTRAYGIGSPVSCNARRGEQCFGECEPGACVGAAGCSNQLDQYDCGSFSGCSWDPDGCHGFASEQCTLGEFGRVPGCGFAESASCVGTPAACWTMFDDVCTSQVGCVAQPGCGGGTFNCAAGDYYACSGIDGCYYDGGCSGGIVDCKDQGRFCGLEAQIVGGCDVYDCSGTPTPCEELSLDQCPGVEGCRLVAN